MSAARRVIGPLAAVALTAAALVGCGSDSSTAGTTTTAAAPAPPAGAPEISAEQRAQIEKLRACLKRQGADLPTGGPGGAPGGGDGGPPQIDRAALQACAKYLPQGGPPGMGAPPSPSS